MLDKLAMSESPIQAETHIRDIYPKTPTTGLSRNWFTNDLAQKFALYQVAAVTGMSEQFIRRVIPKAGESVTLAELLDLLDLDAYAETFIPRSRIPAYLLSLQGAEPKSSLVINKDHLLQQGCAKDLIPRLESGSIQCVVTSTPYWGMRLYNDAAPVSWADGETCVFGNEQTPESFVRHTTELLYLLKPALTASGSVWWNLMDTYNTRTQIRQNAAETLRAMQGKDQRGWLDYDCRRYSAGHSYLKDGEQCSIPAKVAERASRLGYYVKSMISWTKGQSMPETVSSRVTREVEYIIHLSIERTPLFNKDSYMSLPAVLGGRNLETESGKLTDVWAFSTSAGRDGHGAQFPLALPSRCIALSTKPGDCVLDPFVGSGTTLVAAASLKRRGIGFDISKSYLATASERLRLLTMPDEEKLKAEQKPKVPAKSSNQSVQEPTEQESLQLFATQ